jgi:asparagine synthase (glutamine-hydrolysing)
MCGIVGGFGKNVEAGTEALVHRGPDAQAVLEMGDLTFGHTRLAILDLDPRSNQPFCHGSTVITFNGEIWNYREVRADLEREGLTFKTTGDVEVLAAALDRWGAEALPRLQGMFAAGWTQDGATLYLARDRFGEVPLHVAKQYPFYFASEKKALLAMGVHPQSIDDLAPGHYMQVTPHGCRSAQYYDAPIQPVSVSREQAALRVRELIGEGTRERTLSDVPVCTLLSGGIDSSAVAWWLVQTIPHLVAYTAVFNPKSNDLKQARAVAQVLGVELREVQVPLPTPDALARVIEIIEMPYKAQVEIGWPCLKLAEAMHADGFKVTFSGEGSDELWASYGFAYHALKKQDWHQYRKALFLSQARKNFARCNKIFMAHSVECRLPFLNTYLVEYALSLPPEVVQDGKSRPKAVMQDAFRGLLPEAIIRRSKVAFQDGLGIKDAVRRVLPSPERFYHAEYNRLYR